MPPPDPEWSSPAAESEEEGSDNEDKEEASSEDEDRDLFGGKYAIKDKEADNAAGRRDDRFAGLPRNAAKYLENFEEDVLKSIPKDVSEQLVRIKAIEYDVRNKLCQKKITLRPDLAKFVIILAKEELWTLATVYDACVGFRD